VLVGTQRGIEMKLVPRRIAAGNAAVAGLKGKGGSTLAKNLVIARPGLADALRRGAPAQARAAFGVGVMRRGLCCWRRG